MSYSVLDCFVELVVGFESLASKRKKTGRVSMVLHFFLSVIGSDDLGSLAPTGVLDAQDAPFDSYPNKR